MLIGAILGAVVVGIIQASFFEWTFHRFWLHRPWLPAQVFTAHTLVHHQLCKFDDTFHVTEEEQEEALHFQWWGGPVLILINMIPWALAAWALHNAGVPFPYVASLVSIASTILVYYLAYEGLHLLMHKPTVPWIENSGFFRFIKNHHRIHHTQMAKNLNVVLPIADFCLGSLVRFEPQATARVTSAAARRTALRHSTRNRESKPDAEATVEPRAEETAAR